MTSADQVVRDQLVFHLRRGDAHQTFEDAIAGFPMDAINRRAPNVPYTFWHIVEHVRFCQADMLDYLRNPSYQAVTFPDEYWPPTDEAASPQRWVDTVAAYGADLDAVEAFIRDEGLELYAAAPHVWQPDHTPLRTVMVMFDHAAYHGGEIGILRQVMGLWSTDRVDPFNLPSNGTPHQP